MAGGGPGRLEELELTGEEVARLRRAFQDEEFRRLFAEYAAEVSDPAQRAVYEAEVAALERQRGVEARFLHPAPGWVLRTSQAAGERRCYLNVCGNALVGRPEARAEPGGSRWSLPHCLAPGREELGRHGRGRRLVYDVLFHPDALRLAARSPRFRRLLDDTALEAVERRFAPGLDRANAVPLRGVKYKGVPQASLLRTPLPGAAHREGEEGDAAADADASPLPPFRTPYAYPPPPPDLAPPPPPPPPAAATPRWTLRQRSYVDLQDYRCSRDSAPSPVPRELEVTVELPLLRSAAQAQLEVRGRELRLDSRRPAAAYRLRLRLPYPVDEDAGRATFDKSRHRLVVTLPVRRPPPACPAGPGEEKEPPRSRHSPASPEEPPAPSDPPGPAATHVGTNHVQLPVCVEGSGPVASGTSDSPGESALTCPAPLGLPPASAPELTSDPETSGRVASGVTDCSIACDRSPGPGAPEGGATCAREAPRSLPSASTPQLPKDPEAGDRVALDVANCGFFACDRSPGPGAPEGATRARDSKCQESECVPRTPEVCVGDSEELPVSLGVIAPTVTQVGLGAADMDLKQSPEVANAVHSSELQDATAPSAQLCGVSSDHPVTAECPNRSSPDQNVGTSWYPGSCSSPVAPECSADLSVVTGSATNSPQGSPLLSMTGLGIDPQPAQSPSSSPPLPPSSLAPPPPLCPPFQCNQDEEALILLLLVPGIVPQSLKGDVGAHHYRVSFASKDSASYSLLLQLPAENKLTSPESSISFSSANVVIHLTKALDTTGLWKKMYFGINEDAMQEKLFITEDSVADFLERLQRPSRPSQAEMERQPLIEVLEVSESRSRIRLKAQGQDTPEAAQPEEKANAGTEDGEHPFRAENCPLAGEHTTPAERASDSLTAAETKEPNGWGQGHCVAPDPAEPVSAAPGKPQITKLQESELAFAADSRTTATEQTQLDGAEHALTGEEVCPDSTESGGPPAPVLRETDMRDGSVQLISHHTTHCAVTFQNPLLYELD